VRYARSRPMTALEKTVSGAILQRIRARRESHLQVRANLPNAPPSSPAPATLREVSLDDYEAIDALKRRWGLVSDSLENWKRLWNLNPALEQSYAKLPMGWVLEAEGKIVGYLGNIALLYRLGDRTLTAVTSSGFVVEPAYRAVSLSLIAAFYRQKSIDLFIATTAIESVGKIARAFGSDPIPQAEYETVMFWVLRPYPFVKAVLKKLELNATLLRMGSLAGCVAVGADKLVRRRWPRGGSTGLRVTEVAISDIGDDFQALWAEKLKDGTRLFAERSAAALRWHFDVPGDRGNAQALCCRENGQLVGYAVIRNNFNQRNGPQRSIIADMLVRKDDPAIVRALFVAAYAHAKRSGSHTLELLGFPPNIREICSEWNPYLRKYPACPFFFKAADPELHRVLSAPAVWYGSPFDGDATLMP
jgi:hypothetical protein